MFIWHGCNRSKLPSTNLEFWKKKITGNIERDRINQERLSLLGWRVLTLWTCEIQRIDSLEKKLKEFLPNG